MISYLTLLTLTSALALVPLSGSRWADYLRWFVFPGICAAGTLGLILYMQIPAAALGLGVSISDICWALALAAFVVALDFFLARKLFKFVKYGMVNVIRPVRQHLQSYPIALVLPTLLLSAVWEEVLFRALAWYFGTGLDLVTGLAVIIVATCLFGVQHARSGMANVLYAVTFGAGFLVAYILSKSLVAVIAAHFAGNLFAWAYTIPRLQRIRENTKALARLY